MNFSLKSARRSVLLFARTMAMGRAARASRPRRGSPEAELCLRKVLASGFARGSKPPALRLLGEEAVLGAIPAWPEAVVPLREPLHVPRCVSVPRYELKNGTARRPEHREASWRRSCGNCEWVLGNRWARSVRKYTSGSGGGRRRIRRDKRSKNVDCRACGQPPGNADSYQQNDQTNHSVEGILQFQKR